MHAVILRLSAGEVGGNHHTSILRGGDDRGWSIGADRSKGLDLVNGSAIHPMAAFCRIPIMRISGANTSPQRDHCPAEEHENT